MMRMRTEFWGSSWRMSDAFWRHVAPLLPKYSTSRFGGRPRVDLRKVMDGIYYVLRTGCQWRALPSEYGAGSTVHRYFQEWSERGVFGRAWRQMLKRYDQRCHIGWNWQSIDGSSTKAPLGGEKNRQKPDRSRQTRR